MEIAVPVMAAILGVLLVLGLAVVLLRRWGESVLRGMRDRAAVRGEEGLRGDGFANFRGRCSDGYPLRGNAALLLTSRALRVVILWPRRKFEIPLERMTRIEITRSFMGRYEPNGFLIIHHTADGAEDAIGLTLRKLPDWVAEIVKAARPYLQQIQNQKLDAGGKEQPPAKEDDAKPDGKPTPEAGP
jgi:hypothetical protein